MLDLFFFFLFFFFLFFFLFVPEEGDAAAPALALAPAAAAAAAAAPVLDGVCCCFVRGQNQTDTFFLQPKPPHTQKQTLFLDPPHPPHTHSTTTLTHPPTPLTQCQGDPHSKGLFSAAARKGTPKKNKQICHLRNKTKIFFKYKN